MEPDKAEQVSKPSGDASSSSTITSTQTVSSIIPPRKKTPNDFRFGKLLGEGSFSSVYLAKEVTTGEEFAIKVCSKSHIVREKKNESIKTEKEALTILSANRIPKVPFFVRLYATFQDHERLYFVMTFGRGGELLKYLQKVGSFDITCCRFYIAELVLALAHLHNLSIIHRDLKPENILLDERGHILITDFGSAKILTINNQNESTNASEEKKENVESTTTTPPPLGRIPIRKNSFVGTAQYVSPEILRGKYNLVGPSADLWALGCIIYQLVSGLPPFLGGNEYIIFQKILKLEYHFPPGFDCDAKDLVEKLLKLDYLERLGSNDTERYTSIQEHLFFNEISWDTIHLQEAPLLLSSNNLSSSNTTTRPILQIRRDYNQIFESIEPGFNPRIIAERLLRDECSEDFPDLWGSTTGNTDITGGLDSDDDEDYQVLLSNSTNQDPVIIETSVQQPRRMSRNRSVIPIDDGERQIRLQEQAINNPLWNTIVKGNLILKQGLVNKKKGLFSRRRMLLLTEGPKLYYCDPNSMKLKGEIPWSSSLNPEPKDFRYFHIHTPNRTYYLEDPEGFALEWCKVINEVYENVYGDRATHKK